MLARVRLLVCSQAPAGSLPRCEKQKSQQGQGTGLLGNGPVPAPEQTCGSDTKVMGTSPGEQAGRHCPAVGTRQQQQLSSVRCPGGPKEGRVTPPDGGTQHQPPWGLPQSPSRSWGGARQHWGKMLVPSSPRPEQIADPREVILSSPLGGGSGGSWVQPTALGTPRFKLWVLHPMQHPPRPNMRGKEPAAAGDAGAGADLAVMGEKKRMWGKPGS